MFGDAAFEMTHLPPFQDLAAVELSALKGMLRRKLNSPQTSSMGRLFDAVASLIGLRQQMRFEGQAAMELEFALDGIETDEVYVADRRLRIARTLAPAQLRKSALAHSALAHSFWIGRR